MMSYRSNPSAKSFSVSITEPMEGMLSLENQFILISSLPNNHKWDWPSESNNRNVKFEQRFSTSTRRYPSSPRNRIIQAMIYRTDPWNIISDCLYNIFIGCKEVQYPKTALKRSRKRNLSESLQDFRKGKLLIVSFKLLC